MTIGDVAKELGFNRHTVTKLLDRLLIEKKVDYEEKGLTKIFFSTGKGKFLGKIDQDKENIIWVDIFKPKFGEEEFIRLNQTKHDHLIRSSSKYRSVGAIAIKKSKLDELINFLAKKVKREI
jgi:diaminopimelate epimerase